MPKPKNGPGGHGTERRLPKAEKYGQNRFKAFFLSR